MPDPRKPKRSGVQLEPGTLLAGRFSIVRRVGGGGMGSVYQARDTRLADRLCAVKEMIEMFADPTQREKAVDDFKREAAVLAQLEHPSIPTIYDHFIENNKYYLVMRWIGGGDLAQQMQVRGGTVDELTVTKWSIQCCDVLHYIHSQQPPIIYRDLKPANLMLDDKTGRVMLVDFGIARIVRPTEKGVTAIGTMGYAPPELFAGKAEPRTDIYSLGATMFHMLTGADPQDNPLLIFDFSKFPTPRKINPKISEGMEKILMRTVAHEVTDRPESALQLMRDLQDHSNLLAKGQDSTPLPPKPPDKVIDNKTVEEAGGQSVFCGNCGEKIGVDDVFCAHCGYRQPEPGPRRVDTPRVTAQIVILGTGEHKPYVIEKESILLGRTDPHTGIFPEIDLTMYDPETKVSRRHARIYRSGEQFLIEDLGSVNGTVVMPVNGGSIRLNTKSPRVLSAGDEVKLGGTHMKFMMI
jgi:serine/threonine-protein kinase